jgi:hypothetical protein
MVSRSQAGSQAGSRSVSFPKDVAHGSRREIYDKNRLAHAHLTALGNTRGGESVLSIKRLAHGSPGEIADARITVRPHPLSVCEPSYGKLSSRDKCPATKGCTEEAIF